LIGFFIKMKKAERRSEIMKKMLIFSVCLVVLTLSTVTKADLYEIDQAMALDMRLLDTSTYDSASLWFVGTLGGTDQIPSGPGIYGSNTMIMQVGFTGNLTEGKPEGGDLDGSATALIGIVDKEGLGLTGVYDDGFALPLANDNGDVWRYRAFYILEDSIVYSSQAVLNPDTSTTLYIPGSLDLSDLYGIGFEIQWVTADNDGKTGDQYSTSVVPVPGAILLGLLGMSAAGIKLRRFA
jgi:hypothetical protein